MSGRLLARSVSAAAEGKLHRSRGTRANAALMMLSWLRSAEDVVM